MPLPIVPPPITPIFSIAALEMQSLLS